jgi:hypothetical protein
MLKVFFRRRDRLSDSDPRVRREAVLALDESAARTRGAELADLLAKDPDRSVRLAAIERLQRIDTLATALDDPTVGAAAAQRIFELAGATGAPLPDHPRMGAMRLRAATPEQQQRELATIEDPQQLIELALKDRGALRSSVLALPVMQTASALSLLEKRSRGSDKSLNRHARESLELLKQLQQQAASAEQRAEELARALTRATTAADRAAHDREQQLYQRFTAAIAVYDGAREALQRHGEALPDLDELRAGIRAPAPWVEPEPPPASEPATDSPAETTADASSATDEQAAPDPAPPTAPVDLQAEADTGPPPDPAAIALQTEHEAERDAEREAARAAERQARSAAAAAASAEADAIEKLLDGLEETLAQGSLAAAQTLLSRARERCDALPPHLARAPGRRLARLAATLGELKDWQTYATAPKREALCEAMQALIDQPLAPPDLAERIKTLRADWRELGPIAHAGDARLADRFNALAEQAFKPCRAYFAEQAEVRQANLVAREQICDQLAQYLADADWQRTDIKAAEQIMRTARDTWRTCVPVDRAAGRALEARFENLQQDLHNRLKAAWAQNIEAKRQIVATAEALVTADSPIETRIASVKDLQQHWKAVGPTPRTIDQQLWTAFRSACDAVFAARAAAVAASDTARQAADADLRQLQGQCAAELDAFETELATLTPAQASDVQTRALRERLQALDALPTTMRQPLIARRDELLLRHQALRQRQARIAYRDRIDALRRWDETFSLAEAGLRGSIAAQSGELPDACFAGRLGRHDDPVPVDDLRRLTLRAEQMAGIAPPPEDQSLRLQVQVERLRAGLSGAVADDPLQLAETWCAIGPKDAATAPLRSRFFTAIGTLLD